MAHYQSRGERMRGRESLYAKARYLRGLIDSNGSIAVMNQAFSQVRPNRKYVLRGLFMKSRWLLAWITRVYRSWKIRPHRSRNQLCAIYICSGEEVGVTGITEVHTMRTCRRERWYYTRACRDAIGSGINRSRARRMSRQKIHIVVYANDAGKIISSRRLFSCGSNYNSRYARFWLCASFGVRWGEWNYYCSVILDNFVWYDVIILIAYNCLKFGVILTIEFFEY